MSQLSHQDFSRALSLLEDLRPRSGNLAELARSGVRALPSFIPSEITTLSICNLRTGHREVVAAPGAALSTAEIESFDHHFHEHPLVRFHGVGQRLVTHRISDSLSQSEFRRTGLYNDYYRRIGIHHAIAVPLMLEHDILVSFVLNRARSDFSDREREWLDLVRPYLARMVRGAGSLVEELLPTPPADTAGIGRRQSRNATSLTPREHDVMRWLASGKADREIGKILNISARTVQKHLEHIYVKLGVESRTAAVMRSRGILPDIAP